MSAALCLSSRLTVQQAVHYGVVIFELQLMMLWAARTGRDGHGSRCKAAQAMELLSDPNTELGDAHMCARRRWLSQ